MNNFNEFLANYLCKKYNQKDNILDSTKLKDLGLDSLDIIDICCEFENETGKKINLDNFKFSDIVFVMDLKNQIQNEIKQKI